MKRLYYTILCAGLLASCSDANKESADTTTKTDSVATASAPAEAAPAPPMDSAAMMKAWETYMTPGDMHKMMASWDGTWSGEVTMWMEPGAPPTKSTSVAQNKMIFGGRYQQATHKGNFNGMPFEGNSLLGYDNAKKVFVNNWIDNMGTGMMQLEGTWDEASKTINFKGECVDPMNGKNMGVRETFTVNDENHQTMAMYMTPAGGKEFQSMEIKATRK